MKSKSSTTIEASMEMALVQRRLPTHPGEMLLEEFLKPLGFSQSAFAIRLGVSFPRLNEVDQREAERHAGHRAAAGARDWHER